MLMSICQTACRIAVVLTSLLLAAARQLPCAGVTGPAYEATVFTKANGGTNDPTLELRDCDLADTVVTVVRRSGDSTRTTPGTPKDDMHVLILIHNITIRSVNSQRPAASDGF